MNKIMIFDGKEVEVFEFKGEILFNPKHVAECLDIQDVNSSIRNFSDKQIKKLKNSDMYDMHIRKLNNAGENFLTESGVYKLIFKSHKKEAEKFQDWVTDEVLPSIRKHGAYMTDNTIENMLNDPDLIIGLATTLKEERARTKELEVYIEKSKPKLDYADEILSSGGAMLVTNIGADYGLSARTLNKILEEERIQRKSRGQWILYKEHMGQGYTTSETEVYGGKARPQTLWTQKGRMLIHEVLSRRGIRALVDLDNRKFA